MDREEWLATKGAGYEAQEMAALEKRMGEARTKTAGSSPAM
jgi:hypothetical protein